MSTIIMMTEEQNNNILKKKYDYAKYFQNYYYSHHAEMMTYKCKTNKIYYERNKKRYECTKCQVYISPSNLKKHLITKKHQKLKSDNKDNILDTKVNEYIC